MFGLRLMFGFFWFCLGFFVFFLVMTLKKLKKLKVFLVFWINWWLKTCEKPKKLRSFLFFCMDCFYMSSKNLSKKPKKTWVFLVFWLTSSKSSSKKPKKPWVFLVFSRSWPKKTKKNSRKTKKNQTWASDQTFSEKFWFFGFLEVFWFVVFSRFSQQGAQNLRSRNVRSVFDIGVAIMFFLFCRHISKKTHSITGLWYPLFPYANAFPQNMSGNLF